VHLVRRKQAAQVIAEQSALLLPWQLLRGVQFLVDARIGGGQMGEVVSGQWQTQSLIRDRGGWRARQILVVIVGAGVGLLMLLLHLLLLLLVLLLVRVRILSLHFAALYITIYHLK